MTIEPTNPDAGDGRDDGEFSTIRISRENAAGLKRLVKELKASTPDAVLRFLIRHYDGSTHLNRFFDLRELCALADRLEAVLLLLATTNLDLGQLLRRTESGHYRRLAQYGDELVVLQNRFVALKTRDRVKASARA